jgi:transposase
LERRVAELEALVRELLAKLNNNSTNSSVPPSANPLNAPKPVAKQPTGRKPGGQPGHPPHLKQLLPPERVHTVVPFIPERCAHCDTLLPAEPQAHDPLPTRHQVADLPQLAALITEYQGHARTCPCCGEVSHAAIPQELRAHSCGPLLTATITYLTGCHHLSKRAVEELVENVFAVPIALGTVSALEQEMSQALAPAHAAAMDEVKQAPVKNVDETSWKQAGAKRWLWLAATARVAVFVIHTGRGVAGLATLLGNTLCGILCSDRWSTYKLWPTLQRQVCWAHLKRDFQKCVDRGGPGRCIGEAGLATVAKIFPAWHLFRGGDLTRQQLQRRLSPVAEHLAELLQQGCACADGKVATLCANLLALEPALWRFVVTEGVEPTNNHAERLLRSGVLWRKTSFGCHSADGCRFVERLLTVVQTLRLQQRNVLNFLHDTLRAYRTGQAIPKLVPEC